MTERTCGECNWWVPDECEPRCGYHVPAWLLDAATDVTMRRPMFGIEANWCDASDPQAVRCPCFESREVKP